MKRKKLTGKQELFCQEYLIDLNATAAATRAKYSPKTATEAGSENLRKPHIQKTDWRTKGGGAKDDRDH